MIDFINNIPLLLTYFVPGAITVLLYRYLMEHEQKNDTLVLYGVIISGIIHSAFEFIGTYANNILICSMIGAVIAIAAYQLVRSRFMRKICGWLRISPTSNVFLNTIDLDGGTLLMVHLKASDEIVSGHIKTIDSSWIVLRDYSFGDMHVLNHAETYSQGVLCVPMSEIKYYETAYDNDNTEIMK